ncbi:hypothetical protein DIURU_005444 [Diutina rugosa]|uniref:TRUD domain-containing protein n=1 Tax=Diutina rugosa TaxID=5481 RepID=A0A642UFI5_DIURU|nr:uncharacterized protein DIURU_005444 [Diutina rugosa]KAA8896931.1 hypothetical protein DIURU_005444 [Diutina rugosa]
MKRANPAPDTADAKRACLSMADRASKVVQEADVGITTFVNDENRANGGFSGMIKALYSDFQVNEIGLDGEVVHLTDEGVVVPKKEKTPTEADAGANAGSGDKSEVKEDKDSYTLNDEDRTSLLEFITAEELQQVEDLFSSGNKMETTTTFDDKQQRTSLHQLLRKAFGGRLETVTSAENTFKICLARKAPKRRGQPHAQESMSHVDENGVHNYGAGPFKKYLHFTVYKENRETMEIASTMSKLLHTPNKFIGFAGTKDRRGVTTQRFSIHRGKVLRVNALNKGLKQTVLGNFKYEDKGLELGDLSGNEFVIAIRDVNPCNPGADIKQVVEKCFNSLKEKGFINYYGLQRFGSFSISTHQLGVHVLRSEWKQAAELILSEQEVMAPLSVEARKIWAETRDPKATLEKMPNRFTAEVSVLRQLEKEQVDDNGEYSAQSYFKALMQIPKNLRMMYSHAYQSYVWNVVASKRFELFGLEVKAGDLVYDNDEPVASDDDFKEDVFQSKDPQVKHLTEEDVASGKYTIYDVILPTPGFRIEYPTTLLDVYKEVMAKDQLDPESMARNVKEFSLTGSYRHVMVKPKNMSYNIVKYKDNTTPLVKTDLELLREGDVNASRVIESEGDKTAVVLKMSLGVSTYATMALREFMKIDTSRFGFTKVDKATKSEAEETTETTETK